MTHIHLNLINFPYFRSIHSRLSPVIETAKTIKGHRNGILNNTKTRIDNGVLEGINSLIQSAKDGARGFRTTKNFYHNYIS
jgi:transposase